VRPRDAPPILEVTDVVKRYGAHCALERLRFAVRPGEVVGLLGPNGAGKTTALSILSSLLAPDAGSVSLDGRPLAHNRALRRRIGLVPQSLAIYPTLSAAQNASYFARVLGASRADAATAARDALDAVGLADRAHQAARALSGGMQRRLNFACGIVHRPDVLLLDEPTVGVDIESRERILALVERLRERGTAVVYSTHYMEEAERLCDRVAIMDHGRIIAQGTPAELIGRLRAPHILEFSSDPPASLALVAAIPGAYDPRPRGNHWSVAVGSLVEAIPALLLALEESGAKIQELSTRRAMLEDVFLALTGRELRDE
jgi:ABC-2 type transport system ATP-binding protein